MTDPTPGACALATDRPFRRNDALAAGHGRRDIDARISAGLWVVLRHGVYIDALAVDRATPQRRHALEVEAARLVVPGAVGSHESAALVQGLPVWPALGHEVVLSRPGRARSLPSRAGAPRLRLHARAVPAGDRRFRHRALVTTAARTIVDLAADRGLLTGCVAAAAGLRAELVTMAELAAVVRGRSSDAAWRLLDIADPRSESVLEAVSWVRFHEHGVELPACQRWVGDAHGAIGRVDFLWERQRVVGEADGLGKYRRATDALVLEKLRQERLEQAGFRVVRWTWRDVVDRPAATMARIRAALDRAS